MSIRVCLEKSARRGLASALVLVVCAAFAGCGPPPPALAADHCPSAIVKGQPSQITLVSSAEGVSFDPPKICRGQYPDSPQYDIRVHGHGKRRIDYSKRDMNECDRPDADAEACPNVHFALEKKEPLDAGARAACLPPSLPGPTLPVKGGGHAKKNTRIGGAEPEGLGGQDPLGPRRTCARRIGLGMLTCKGTDARHRRIAYALVGFSMLAHVYAFTTMRVGEPESRG